MTARPELHDSTLSVEAGVATLTLERDDVRNALTGTRLSAEIVAVADWLNASEEAAVLVVTGGGKSFSAGGNVKHMRDRVDSFAGDAYTLQRGYRLGIQQMALALHRVEVPTIAAVNGAAIGAGFDLACMCDLRFAAEGALFGETFVNLGIIPGDGGAWFLQRLVGYQRAAELTLTGRVFDAAEAKELGIVLEVLPPDELLPRALSLAAELAGKPPQALRLTKRLLKAAQRTELEECLDLSGVFQAVCHQTEDHHEAVAAFIDKRPPVFKGR
jgi:enoyl-CoA hydratase/carnithine racemase